MTPSRYFTSAHQPAVGAHDRRHGACARFREHTPRDYVRQVRAFAAFMSGGSPDTATAEDVRLFSAARDRWRRKNSTMR